MTYKKKREWDIEIDGFLYHIEFLIAEKKKDDKLLVNGTEVPIKYNVLSKIAGHDQPIMLGSKECRFVVVEGNDFVDIAVDGYYVNAKTPYKPFVFQDVWMLPFLLINFFVTLIFDSSMVCLTISLIILLFNAFFVKSSPTKKSRKLLVVICTTLVGLALCVFDYFRPFGESFF